MTRLIARLWSLYARVYDGLLSFWPYRHLLELVAARLAVKPGYEVLDLGCGTGNLINMAHQTQPQAHYTGIDMSDGMLRVATRKLRAQVAAGQVSLERAELMAYLAAQPDRSFDIIASINVLYTVADQTALWRELFRVLKSGGRIIVTTSTRPGSSVIIREHFRHSNLWSLLRWRLIGVFVIDALINLLGRTGHFAFADETILKQAVTTAGGSIVDPVRCYGGDVAGVNILFTAKK